MFLVPVFNLKYIVLNDIKSHSQSLIDLSSLVDLQLSKSVLLSSSDSLAVAVCLVSCWLQIVDPVGCTSSFCLPNLLSFDLSQFK